MGPSVTAAAQVDADTNTEENTSPQKVMLVARVSRETQKPGQFSFSKGDIVELVDGSRKWHKGILRKSSKY